MADVTGDIGGQPVQLNNAATEATLKQLVAAIALMSARMGKDAKTQKQLDAELKKFASQLDRAGKTIKSRAGDEAKLSAEQKKALKAKELENKQLAEKRAREEALAKAQQEYKQRLQNSIDTVQMFTSGINDVGLKAVDLAKDLSQMGDNIEAAGSALREIPVFGGLIGAAFSAVASAANKTYDSFVQMSSVGANFGGSIQEMQRTVSETGLTLDQFTNLVKNNAESLALMGGSAQEGAKRLGRLGREMRASGVETELLKLGFTTEQINNGMASFGGTLAKTGALRGMTDKQVAEATGSYLKNLDAVSRLTGQSREDLQKQRDERMRDSQLRLMMANMDAESQANLHALMDSIPKEHSAGLKEIMATGTATSQEGVKALAYLRQMGVDAQSFGQQVRSTGKLTKEQMIAFGDQYQRGATQFAKSGLASTLGKFGEEGDKAFVTASLDVAARTKTFGQAMEESAEASRRAKEAGLTPEDMARNKQAMTDLSNQFLALLANSELLPALLGAFKSGMEVVGPILISTFEFVGNNAMLVGAVLTGLAVTLGIFKAAMLASEIAIKLETMKRLGLIKPSAALGNLFGFVGKIVKGVGFAFKGMLGPIGLVAGLAYLLYDNWDLVKEAFVSFVDWVDDMIDKLLLRLPNAIGGISKEEYARRKQIRDDARKQRDEDKKKLEATKRSTEATEKDTEATKEAAEAKVSAPTSYTDPNAMMRGFAQQQQRPTMGAVPSGSAGSYGALQAQLAKQGITDPTAVANIMAQVQAESGGVAKSENLNYSGKKLFELYGAGNKAGNKVRFKTMEEANAVAAKGPEAVGNVIYGGRMGNAGDEGFKYRGRGLIQLTGKDNYAKFGKILGIDLVGNPDLANDPQIAQQIAAAYFAEKQKKGVNLSDINQVNKAVGFAGGAAEGAKRAQMATAFQSQLGGAAPSASAAQTAVAQAPAAAASTAVATAAAPSTPAARRQESAESLLASLNSKMDTLIAINQQTSSAAEKQVRVTSALSSDMMVAA